MLTTHFKSNRAIATLSQTRGRPDDNEALITAYSELAANITTIADSAATDNMLGTKAAQRGRSDHDPPCR